MFIIIYNEDKLRADTHPKLNVKYLTYFSNIPKVYVKLSSLLTQQKKYNRNISALLEGWKVTSGLYLTLGYGTHHIFKD